MHKIGRLYLGNHLERPPLRATPRMTSWHLVVGARLLVREIHADAKTMGPFAQASVTKVQNAKIKQDRMPK